MLAWSTLNHVCDAVESQPAMLGLHLTILPDLFCDRYHA
jgi:hypothetical protein